MTTTGPPRNRKELYDRIARGGKDEVILEEMVRLGFWPQLTSISVAGLDDPPDEVRRRTELRQRLQTLRDQAARLRNLRALEKEQKAKRLAESKKRREQTKQKMLGERAAAKEDTKLAKTRELRYLGAGVSAGLGKRQSDDAALASLGLPALHSAADLAAAMKLPLGQLRFLAFAREVSTTTHYRRFTIPKRTGGERLISAPRTRLKAVQRWILTNLLDKLLLAEPAHGFRIGRSTVSNAIPHVGAGVVINVDLRDFFPTVTYRRVKGLFAKLGYSEEVATVLALVCSEPDITETELDGVRYYVQRGQRRLPQGAPTSPAITNALCRRLDRRIAGWAAKRGFIYTRYADDLTVSAGHKSGERTTRSAAKGSAKEIDTAAPVGKMLAFIRKVVADEGFHVHPDKVRVVRKGRRQEVTGVVVNERPGVPRDELRRFRALLYQIDKDGPAGKKWGAGGDVLVAAAGFASYVMMVDRAKGEALRDRVRALRAKYPVT